MNPLIDNLMREATRLTGNGRLVDATRAIQQALAGTATGTDRMSGPASAAGPDTATTDDLVIDVEARLLEPEPEPEPARPNRPGGGEEAADQWAASHFSHQNRQLAYKLFVPAKDTGRPRPLLLMLHGCTQDPDDFAAGTRMNAFASEHGFLVLYPAQAQHANSSRCWNWFKAQHQARGRGEPALLAALTRSVADSHAVDPARIYVAGLSAGGAMADILGRAYPELFAAVGVHSGLPAGAASDLPSALAAMKQGPQRATASGATPPTIIFHGDADGTVSARNGAALVAAALSGRPDARSAASTESGRSPGGRGYTRQTHADERGRPVVEHWLLHGAGHAWAGGSVRGSYTDPAGPDASAEMLRFFLRHHQPPPRTA